MNGNDISRLSYKELQALAIRYRVPGNIKKKLLVKVLQAAKSGNGHEVERLLQDLKHTRKKPIRKIKVGKLGLTSTPLHSPDYVMADNYYCPQQQPPYQWVGAEEEIASRDDDGHRSPHYEEFKQFLLKRIHREFQTYDPNNNEIENSTIEIEDSAIMDLRTVPVSSDIYKDSLDANNYIKSNIIAVNSTDSFEYQPSDNVEYQTLGDANNNVQGPILLKKMLQAPVGANLGEIASPVPGNYRLWSIEQYQSNDFLDNSDTLTAESDNQENEENLNSNTECYGFLSGIKGEYFLNMPSFGKNIEEINQQISTVLTNESGNEYKYPSTNINMHQECENWTITNVMEATDNNCVSDIQTSKVFQPIYYDDIESDTMNKSVNNENLMHQHRVPENVHSYSSGHTLLNLDATEENQYYDTNIIRNIKSDCTNTYYLQNLMECSTETNVEYLQNMYSFTNATIDQGTYTSTISQTFSTNNQYNFNPQYEYSNSYNDQASIPLLGHAEQYERNYNSIQNTSCLEKNILDTTEKVQTNGILDPFWPNKISKISTDSIVENILNFITTKRIDFSKLDQTSCVYCYIAPIVTHTPVSSNISCSQKEKFVAEYRQHSFSPHWLLYNDTSCGMRMANLQTNFEETAVEDTRILYIPSSNSNSDFKDSTEENEVSILEVWPHNYANYEMTTGKDTHMCQDVNVEVTDCLLSVINTEPLVSQTEEFSKSQAQ